MDFEYKVITDLYTIQQIRNERYQELSWSPEEKLFKNRPQHANGFFKDMKVPISLIINVKLKRSLFGIFLREFNPKESQNLYLNDTKLGIMKHEQLSYSKNALKQLKRNNEFTLDLKRLLSTAVKECDVIDMQFLYNNISVLRFTETPLTTLDGELRKFVRLKILILCGNWIDAIDGQFLPKKLEYLELYGNQITSVERFVNRIPKKLVHIGLKRNWLTNESKLHLLATRGKFDFLKNLDLSENDIYDLVELLRPLSCVETLVCLSLQGNPCAVITSYKDTVLRHLPWLIQLDQTTLLEKDYEVDKDIVETPDAAIVFTCHRITGLLKPKPEKGVEQCFYFSINMPLLEDIVEVEPPEEESEIQELFTKRRSSGGKSNKGTTKGSKDSKASKGEFALYNKPDEYAKECSQRIVDTTFKSERFHWDKIMQLPEEAVIIKSAEENFADIRDTFRSSVCVKLIYLEIAQQGKGKVEKSKKSKKSDTKLNEQDNKRESTPKETIKKKITLASFNCDLHSINWSDKTIDYIWADQPRFAMRATEVQGSLRSVNYIDKGNKADKEKGKDKKSQAVNDVKSNSMTDNKPVDKIEIPNVFMIQIGFGLQRTYFQT